MTGKLAAEGLISSPASQKTEPMFPVQNGPEIPWAVIAPFEKQAQKQHGGQTLERLAERGGLSVCEVLSVLEGEGNYTAYHAAHPEFYKNVTAQILRLQSVVKARAEASSPATPQPTELLNALAEFCVDVRTSEVSSRLRNRSMDALRQIETFRTRWLTEMAAYSATPALEQWQPIETAPKDGTPVILLFENEVYKGVWALSASGEYAWRVNNLWLRLHLPDHWMPMPPRSALADIARLRTPQEEEPERSDGEVRRRLDDIRRAKRTAPVPQTEE